jgi:inner membrane protein
MPKTEDYEESMEWRKRHRRLTHWFVPYAVLALACFVIAKVLHAPPVDVAALVQVVAETTYSPLFPLFGFVFLGGLFHILEDAICGKVPSLNPRKRIGVRLFKVGSFGEYLVSSSCIIAILLFGAPF